MSKSEEVQTTSSKEESALSPEERFTGMSAEQLSEYITFAAAAKSLDVRFQQVYQRAVIRNKMRWVDTGKRKIVHKDDVEAWRSVRKEYFAKSSK